MTHFRIQGTFGHHLWNIEGTNGLWAVQKVGGRWTVEEFAELVSLVKEFGDENFIESVRDIERRKSASALFLRVQSLEKPAAALKTKWVKAKGSRKRNELVCKCSLNGVQCSLNGVQCSLNGVKCFLNVP
jgi:hypothetical protein